MRAVILLQVVLLAVTGALLALVLADRGDRADREDRAAALTARAAALEAEGRFAAAALAHERAARITADPASIDAALDAANRAEALAIVAADALPPPSERARLDALAEAIAAAPGAADRITAALLDAVRERVRGNLDAAGKRLEEARATGDDDPWFDWQLGAIYLQQGRTTDAVARLEALARARPGFGPGLHRLGLAYLADKRDEAAIGALQRAITAGAGPDAALDLARIFLARQMWAEAIPHLEAVLRGRGGDVEALRLLAAAHFRLGRHELAARTYRAAHRLDLDPRTLLSAAIALAAGGKQGEALAVLDDLQPRAAELPEVAWQRARILLDLDRRTEAQVALRTYLAAAAGRPEEAERVAQARRLLGEAPAPAAMPADAIAPAATPPAATPPAVMPAIDGTPPRPPSFVPAGP
ncbi:MAG: tetratricopeptide repeat protein [Myxococcales bacterium]|nr:tetratricopeptide repeat protein [Myxococcales bacterium]MCB9550673.1 tetratricopeptide repeat protein [Myxococcales bacterium]